MKHHRILPILLLFSYIAHAQDSAFARKTINILASDFYAGRGYVNSGNTNAANYISNEYKRIGLQPLPGQKKYFQRFSMPVNTFPNDVVLRFGGHNDFYEGKDFLIHAASPAFNLQYINLYHVKDSASVLEIIVTEKEFNTISIIALGSNFESKPLRELSENVKSYCNKKNIEIDLLQGISFRKWVI